MIISIEQFLYKIRHHSDIVEIRFFEFLYGVSWKPYSLILISAPIDKSYFAINSTERNKVEIEFFLHDLLNGHLND